MLAGSRRLKGVIAFLEDLKIFRRYLDREWIVIILLPVSIAKIFQKVGDVPFAFRVTIGHSPVESELNVKIWPFFLILIAR